MRRTARKHRIRAVRIGVGQRGAGDRPGPQMVKPGRMAFQASGDVAQALSAAQLAIQQRDQMIPRAELAHPSVGAVLIHQVIEHRPWNVVHQVMQNAILMPHGIASSCPERVERPGASGISAVRRVQKNQPDNRGWRPTMTM